ncbi:MAG: glycoside hydrolase, partial [Lachnospiraceae bacterium]|nr:glycoside hydrolase [Lachnospiraceae bacterium]
EVNGPHQGAWIDTPDGQDWFIHFQDVGNAGRIIHLQPMRWEDDWPVIGVNDKDGCGEPVGTYKKPGCKAQVEIDAPEDSDDFTSETLGLQWQWNANYKDDWYALRPDKGQIILYAKDKKAETQLCDVPNLLVQKWPAPEFMNTSCLHVAGLRDGDIAGMISLGGVYAALSVEKKAGKLMLTQRIGRWTKKNEVVTELTELSADKVFLRMKVEKEKYISFYYSLDGEKYEQVGATSETAPGRWVGVKSGLFAVHEGEGDGGKAAFEGFFFDKI